MTEFPFVVELESKRSHKLILAALEARFERVPDEVVQAVTNVTKERKLLELNRLAATCKDLSAFIKRLKA